MKFPWTVLVIALPINSLFFIGKDVDAPHTEEHTNIEKFSSAEKAYDLKIRLERINFPFEARLTSDVARFIKESHTIGLRNTEATLGRMERYIPIFEHYLKKYGLPESLKYLPIVESKLDAWAESPVGAKGLWQLMEGTAKQSKLIVNSTLDERMDPYRATEAAVKNLAELHLEFNDWGLALAAYNCGPQTVRNAINKAGSSLFWDVVPMLPPQTQRYIPSFIAAAYVANYYSYHKLHPRKPKHYFYDLRVIKIYNHLTFKKISQISGVEERDLATLNPSYLLGQLPYNKKGNYLTLPAKALPILRAYLFENHPIFQNIVLPANAIAETYVVQPGEKIHLIAKIFDCQVEDVVEWNGLAKAEVVPGQELVIYVKKNTGKKQA